MNRGFRIGLLAGILSLPGAVAHADVVTDWNALMVTTVGSQNPFAQARFAAITQLDLDDPDARFSLQLALKLRPVLR